MEAVKKIPLLPFLVYIGYVLLWGAGQYVSGLLEEFSPFLSLTVFYLLSIIPFGIIVPLKVAKKLEFKLHNPASPDQLRLGALAFLIVILIGSFSTDAYSKIIQDPTSLWMVVKSLLLVLPFSLGVSLNILFLIPRALQTHLGTGFLGVIVPAFACGLAMGIAWMFDTQLADFNVIMTMLIFGTLFGFGAALSRSLYFSFAAFSIVMVINILVDVNTFNEPLPALILGFGLTSLILILSVAKEKGAF